MQDSSQVPDSGNSRRPLVVVVAAISMAWLVFFGPVLTGNRSLAFRDASHFYYPLFQWAENEWASGRIPLWNPQENCGSPVLAETAASVLYPPKLLFAAPLPFAWKYNLFVALHVLLAAWAAYLLARRFRVSVYAAGLCSASYAFGGGVLFQYCNVVFLVGAAWLPWALFAGTRLMQTRRWRWSVALGAALAMSVLGGDPHTAYHAGLLVALYGLVRWRSIRRRLRPRRLHSTDSTSCLQSLAGGARCGLGRNRCCLLLLGGLWGLALAAVQILPAAAWTRQSERAVYDDPRSLYEAVDVALTSSTSEEVAEATTAPPWSRIERGLFGQPKRDTHHFGTYYFSVGPWRWGELLWPNVSGRMFPTHRRWLNVIPAEGRVWSPSLYVGLLPIALAIIGWNPWSRSPTVRWLSWSAILFGLGSLGWYGFGWLAKEICFSGLGRDPDQVPIGSPVGGVYWFLTLVLPGYVYFRFPAKLLVIAGLSASLLAAIAWDRIRQADKQKATIRFLLGLGVFSSLAAVATIVFRGELLAQLQQVRADPIFGPLDALGAARDILGAFGQTTLVAFLLAGVLYVAQRWPRFRPWPWLFLLTVVELAVAHSGSVVTAPVDLWQTPSAASQRFVDDIERSPNSATVREQTESRESSTTEAVTSQQPVHPVSHAASGRVTRTFRGSFRDWRPVEWKTTSDRRRLQQLIAWERDTLFPKFQLLNGQSLVEAYSTIASADLNACFRVARDHGWSRGDGVHEPDRKFLQALNVEHYVLPPNSNPPGLAQSNSPTPPTSDAELCRDDQFIARTWIVHRVERRSPLGSRSRRQLEAWTRDCLYPHGQLRPLRDEAVVESETPLDIPPASPPHPSSFCKIRRDTPQQIEIEATLDRPGLLILSDLYTKDWVARVEGPGSPSRVAPVLRTNRIMRGVALPAGRWNVTFLYRPREFYYGATISILAWLVALATFMFRNRLSQSCARRP